MITQINKFLKQKNELLIKFDVKSLTTIQPLIEIELPNIIEIVQKENCNNVKIVFKYKPKRVKQ